MEKYQTHYDFVHSRTSWLIWTAVGIIVMIADLYFQPPKTIFATVVAQLSHEECLCRIRRKREADTRADKKARRHGKEISNDLYKDRWKKIRLVNIVLYRASAFAHNHLKCHSQHCMIQPLSPSHVNTSVSIMICFLTSSWGG